MHYQYDWSILPSWVLASTLLICQVHIHIINLSSLLCYFVKSTSYGRLTKFSSSCPNFWQCLKLIPFLASFLSLEKSLATTINFYLLPNAEKDSTFLVFFLTFLNIWWAPLKLKTTVKRGKKQPNNKIQFFFFPWSWLFCFDFLETQKNHLEKTQKKVFFMEILFFKQLFSTWGQPNLELRSEVQNNHYKIKKR